MLVRDTIYQALRRAILSCEFRPGQELRELALAERFHVSRSPIRDSLLRLEQENLVTVLPRQGYRVNPISISGAEDLFRLRLLIEPACARAAAEADDVELRTLDHFRGIADRSNSLFGFIEYYKSFHEAVAGLSGNKRMAEVARNLIEQSERLVRITVDVLKHEAVHRSGAEHEAIIDALQAHDAERAARLSREHVEGAHKRMIAALQFAEQQGMEPAATSSNGEGVPHDDDSRGRGS